MKTRKKRGFTILELLTVIFIISILTSLSFVYFREGEKMFSLQRSAQKLAQDIRRAQQMAISTKKCCRGNIPAGYGIYLHKDDNFYILYADTNPANGNEEYDDGYDIIIEEIYFEKGVYIKDIIKDIAHVTASSSINFKPPDPKVRIVGNGTEANEVSIVIALQSDSNKTKTVRVNKAGLISIE